ncbi:hypothetical protein [Mycobacterium sp. DL440]|uniref:hypothetical protein n=1 Tax=Mycobacterium sp. DL440 TaxID=2675523 RepID=UPI001AAEEEC9|nr:hypothetical protein [Mycobacterium sp. DL440]
MRRGRHRANRFSRRVADLGAVQPSRHPRTVPLGEVYGRLEFDARVAAIVGPVVPARWIGGA